MSILFWVSFQSEILIQVYMIPNQHFIPDQVFGLDIKNRINSIPNEL